MENFGFVKVAAAIPGVKVADCNYNSKRLYDMICEAADRKVQILCFPELSITGYTCADLFAQSRLIDVAEKSLVELLGKTRGLDIVYIVGSPVICDSTLFNCAVVCFRGKIMGIVPKTYLPNYKEFYEKRWFAPAFEGNRNITYAGCETIMSCNALFELNGNSRGSSPYVRFGVEICEDLWAPIPPSCNLVLEGADIVFNLSASNELVGKHDYLRSLISQQSARCIAGYVYSSCGFGESTQDVVFAGNALIYENGKCLEKSERFSLEEQLVISEVDVERVRNERMVNGTFAENIRNACLNKHDAISMAMNPQHFEITRRINPYPFVPEGKELEDRCKEIFSIQVEGLAKRIIHINPDCVVVGVSGGLDSTLALLVCVSAMDKLRRPRTDVVGITMPCFGTSRRTHDNAVSLMKELGVTSMDINITVSVRDHFKDIVHDESDRDVTYENCQARERTQVLMDMASQKHGFVVGTGDVSELALGWCTYNADHMSMYNVNVSIPKTLVRSLVRWVADDIERRGGDSEGVVTLRDIIDTPVSPELLPPTTGGEIAQKTEDAVGPYDLHDFFLYYFLRFGFAPSKIFFLATKAFPRNQFSEEEIRKWLKVFIRRFFSQQFKRSCLPDGPKVGSISLSPRGDWRMPSDADDRIWTEDLSERI
ncbi:MAG: NAD(+) synthase [Bacteroidales bacterium]|jgi:NAD+ synthase (glutamine-hydrolysing)|nr:NAD(+) synthase [Bacteroidales bacterium]MCI2122245.1 NAD(+) synthase [Bacteroidales bacterium]MCI2144805.1 NAD(+) synthase [Bacteroidales bacterium]